MTVVLWPPDKRLLPQYKTPKYFLFFFFRLTLCKDNKSCLSTFDTQTSVTIVTPADGIVKGMASFRYFTIILLLTSSINQGPVVRRPISA